MDVSERGDIPEKGDHHDDGDDEQPDDNEDAQEDDDEPCDGVNDVSKEEEEGEFEAEDLAKGTYKEPVFTRLIVSSEIYSWNVRSKLLYLSMHVLRKRVTVYAARTVSHCSRTLQRTLRRQPRTFSKI